MRAQVALREVAGAAADHGAPGDAARRYLDQGADAVAGALCADQAESQPMVRGRRLIAPEVGGTVVGGDEQVGPAVVADVAPRTAATDDRLGERPAAVPADLIERAVVLIVEQERGLAIVDSRLALLDLILNVAVHLEQVLVTVVVVVEEQKAEAEDVGGCRSYLRGLANLLEQAGRELPVERRLLALEVGDRQPCLAVVEQIAGIDPHARMWIAVLIKGDAALSADLGEGAVPFVVELEAGDGVVGDKEIGPAVAVVVPDGHAERLAPGRADPGGAGHIFKAAVSLVVVESTVAGLIGRRDAVDVPLSGSVAGLVVGQRSILDIVADEEVQAPIAIIVQPGAGGAPLSLVGDTGGGGDVGEARRAAGGGVVAEQVAGTEDGGHVEVVPAVIVVIADRGAHRVDQFPVQARGVRHVRERPIPVVVVERHRGPAHDMPAGKRGVVEQQQILPAIAVVIEKRAAGADRLDHVLAGRGGALMPEVDAGGRRDVGEVDGRCRTALTRRHGGLSSSTGGQAAGAAQ